MPADELTPGKGPSPPERAGGNQFPPAARVHPRGLSRWAEQYEAVAANRVPRPGPQRRDSERSTRPPSTGRCPPSWKRIAQFVDDDDEPQGTAEAAVTEPDEHVTTRTTTRDQAIDPLADTITPARRAYTDSPAGRWTASTRPARASFWVSDREPPEADPDRILAHQEKRREVQALIEEVLARQETRGGRTLVAPAGRRARRIRPSDRDRSV